MEVWERVKNKKHPLHGLSGGASDYNDVGGNSNGKVIKSMQQKQHHNQGHGEGQSQKQDKSKHKYPTFKYSSRLRGVLHEAILLNDEPAFLTYSNNHSKVVKQIEEVNRILIPPCIEEYPSYEPIEFKSLSEIERYEVNAKNETIDTLYLKIRNTVSLYIDQDEEIQNLVSADILWTYFQDLFPTTHYYNIVGRGNGIGKSSIGFIFEGIAYRAVRMTNPSVANVYRVLERIEAGQCTLVLDEADGVHEDRYMMGILKEGYSIGGKVPKVNMTTGKQEWFFSYGFKIIIAEDSLSPGTARGLIDRIFIKGKPKHDIKEVLHPGNRDKILEKLHNDLRDLRRLLLVYRMIHFDDPIVNRDVGLDGRDKELCKPLLQLFYGTDAYKQVEGSLMKFLDKKNKRKKNVSIDSMLYEIIVNLLSSNGERIYNSDIWQAIQDNIPGAPIDPKKPNEYQSYEYDTIYRKTAIKIIEGFGAEPDRDHNGRFLKFDLHTFVKSARQFDIDNVSLQSRLESVLTTKSHRHIVTSSRPENDINITGNGEAHIEIIKKSVDRLTELEIATPSGARKPLPRLGNGDLGIRPFMVRIMQERYNVIAVNPSLIQSYPWPTTKPYYNLRKMLDHLGYNIDETYPPGHKLAGKVILAERRPYIQGKMLTEICEKEFGMKRHELGIFVDERTQFVYRGESQSVGFYDIDSLINKGTDFILCEKAYAVKPIAPLASPYGIVLLECGGNFVEYARMLCEKAVRRGCNVGILTDFDISGIAMCINIPWATRIGIDERTIYDLGLTEKQIKIVQERYNADPGQMKFVIETLNKYNSKKGWIDGPLDWSGEGTYNLELVKSLNLDQRRALRYLAELRIELDHVIDEAGPERFFQYLKKTMEDRFRDRDYNYTVESATVDEIRPPTAKEFVAKMDKLLLQIPALQPALTEISNEHRNDIDGLQPIDEIRQDMLDRLIETEEEDPKVKRLLPKLVKIMKELGLPELTDEEKRNL